MKRLAIAVALAAAFTLPAFAQDAPPADPTVQPTPVVPAEPQAPVEPAADQAQPVAGAQAAPSMTPDMQAMMDAWQKASTPGPQHAQLAEHFAGSWTTKQTMWMDPSTPPMTETGTSTNTAEFGGRHVRSKFGSRFMGQPFSGEAITSYDNTLGKYVNVWVDNMSTGHFLSRGDYDPATKTYTFNGEMADPMKAGTMTPVREVIRIVNADHHVMEMYETRDGKEAKTMVIEYTRAAP